MQEKQVKISVIVPVYNAMQWLDACVGSVLNQTFQDFELILVNDGSTDGSGDVCDRYATGDNRIKVIHKTNGYGAGEARNVGLLEAKGEFVVFLDSDDQMKPWMLERMYTLQKSADYDLVIGGYVFLEEKGKIGPAFGLDDTEIIGNEKVIDYFVRYYPDGLIGYPWNKLYRRQIIVDHGLTFPKLRRLEDGIFNVAYIQHVERLCVVKEPMVEYRVNSQVTLRKLPYDFYENILVFSKNYYGFLKKHHRDRKAVEGPFVFYFLNDFVCCLENMLTNSWPGRSYRERKADVLNLLEEKQVIYMLKKKACVHRYSRWVLTLFEKRQIEVLTGMIYVKIWIKLHGKQLFDVLKRVAN